MSVLASSAAMATLSEPSGVGIIVAVVAMTAAALSRLIPAWRSTGYSVAIRMIARLEALGMTRDNRLPNKKVIGTRIYGDLMCAIGLASTLTVTSLAPIWDM